MVYLIFGIAAIAIIFLAVKLSVYADTIEEKAKVSGILIALLLGGATSLPEITTSVTSIVISNPNLAVGNVLGSNFYNILILACIDIFFRKHQLFNYSSRDNTYSAVLILFLSTLIALSILLRIPYNIFGVGLDTIALIVSYFIGMKLISKYSPSSVSIVENTATNDAAIKKKDIPLKTAIAGFIIVSIFVMIFGTALTITADKIAVLTGLGSTFVGSFLVAASTSLPEAVSVSIAIKLRNYKLAIGGILGSNLFNLLIFAFTDIMYRDGAILFHSSGTHLYTVLASIVLVGVCLYALIRKQSLSRLTYIVPSVKIVVIYFIASYVIYVSSAG
ncbi:sodium:calcium antiporter [Bacillus sp. HMF5848]|uniref:sodium:calcium antiporter n=1 Tax=Bacillus sp. HMF5848 TaxID=2495421 RepID=UPI000F7A318C|nr:sodium:calcium antiporter [Bacillus sp. HMF5848]RSK26118.1 sodium:calcium antiporter [Bacillus sp. HMF5848]